LDPEGYELRAVMNTPNMRTTFYGSTKGIEETADLLKLKSKHRKHKKARDDEKKAKKEEKKEEKKAKEPSGDAPKPGAKKEDAAAGNKAVLPPEKVHTLDPEAY